MAAAKPAKPKITVKASEDGSSVTVTIKKTNRTPGFSSSHITFVREDGFIKWDARGFTNDEFGIRPAMVINLK